jgi:hypothetical protein
MACNGNAFLNQLHKDNVSPDLLATFISHTCNLESDCRLGVEIGVVEVPPLDLASQMELKIAVAKSFAAYLAEAGIAPRAVVNSSCSTKYSYNTFPYNRYSHELHFDTKEICSKAYEKIKSNLIFSIIYPPSIIQDIRIQIKPSSGQKRNTVADTEHSGLFLCFITSRISGDGCSNQ